MLFDRLIVIRNPISTDAHRAARRIHELRELCPSCDVIVLDTKRGGRPPNAQLLKRHQAELGERTLLCIAGGDGTVNMFLDILLYDTSISDTARQTPILPLWGGNANDLAYMLNGSPTHATLAALFQKGRIVKIYPMMCTLRHQGRTDVHVAACYASFGASGFAMQELERSIRARSPMRQPAVTRFGGELVGVAWSLMRSPTFTVSESNKRKVIFERMYLNGSRFAKVAAVPLRLTDRRFHRTTAEHKNVFTIAARMLDLIRDRAGRRLSATHDSFTVHDAIWAQFDGEVVSIPAEAHISMDMADRPFYALSIRLG
jgi:diacylglycerol kinase family enzyme